VLGVGLPPHALRPQTEQRLAGVFDIFQIPPDLVVKFQAIDIVEII
jgi:hypothetical protein